VVSSGFGHCGLAFAGLSIALYSTIRLARAHSEAIQLLLTDVVMPEMNGRDLAKQLPSFSPVLKCLFISGYSAEVIAHNGVLDPGVHFIQKPFSPNALAIQVRTMLDAPAGP
jgi:two-component system, cell cycle sensor histidine kinase and response regulator CckA